MQLSSIRIGMLGLALASVSAAQELPASLSLEDALRLFDARGFDLLVAETSVESARADTLSAAAIPNPGLSANVGKAFTSDPGKCTDPGCSAISWGVGLNDNGALFDSVWGKRSARMRGAAAAWAAARLSRDDARRTLHFQLETALVEAVRAGLALEATRHVQHRLQQVVELNRVRYQSGAISEADLAKVETESLGAEADVDRAQLAVTQARVAVAFLLGVRGPMPAFEVDPSLLSAVAPRPLADATQERLLQIALERRPDLKAAAAQVDRAEASIDGAQRQVLPDIQLAPQFSMLGFGQQAANPPVVALGAQVALPALYRYQGELAKARADREMQRIAQDKTRAQVTADVQVAWASFSSAKRRLDRMQTTLLERAKRARDLIQLQYQKGAGSLLELLDAERQLLSTNLEYVQDLADFWTAIFQLEQAVGTGVRT